jgi:pimeloyl-ACP methyl ester carboxylesterase
MRAMRLSHHREGAGEPLMLLHGIGHHWQAWCPVIGMLAEHCDVVAADLPGFGASPQLHGRTPTVAALADAIEQLAFELGWQRFHVAGNSVGGRVALELGRRGAALSVCAISPIGFWSPLEAAWTRSVLRASRLGARVLPPRAWVGTPRRRRASQWLYRSAGDRQPRDDALAEVAALASAPGWRPTLRATIRGRFGDGESLCCPVTVAWGDRDRLTRSAPQRRRARRALPAARHVTLAGCGHVPMLDDPEQVARVILDARRRSPAPRGPAAA